MQRRERTASETIDALRTAAIEEELEDILAMSDEEVEAAIRAQGGDPDAIGARGEAYAAELLERRERLAPWQEKAATRMARAWARAKAAPKTERDLPRATLLERIEVARRDARFDAPIAAAFRNRGPDVSTDEELAELLDEIEALKHIAGDEGDDE